MKEAEFYVSSAERHLSYKYPETKLSIIFHYLYLANKHDDKEFSTRIELAKKN